ncbi:MAG: GNAT family acetyltransferase [Gammaproteobacteria bacterium]
MQKSSPLTFTNDAACGFTAVKIRAFSSDDEAAVIDLWRRCDLIRPWNDPVGDIAQCLNNISSTLFVASEDGRIIGSVMVGYDGHRGWVYYLAVDPEKQKRGNGRALMRQAETWILQKGGRKIHAMIREENLAVSDFYRSLSYENGDVRLMQKWLKPYPSGDGIPEVTDKSSS